MIRSTCERCGSFFQGPEADVAPPSWQDLSGQCLACIESNDSIFKVAWPIPFNASNSNGSALAIWFLRQFEKPDFLTGIAQLSLVITFGGAFLFFLSGIINYMITEVGTAGLQQLPDNRTLIVALILNLVFAGIVSEFIFAIYGFAAKIVLGYRIDDQVPVRAAIVTHISPNPSQK